MQIVDGIDIELKDPCERVEDLRGRVIVTALLEAKVVGGADASQRRHLLATQTRHAPPRASNEPDVFGTELLAPCT
jgi:hypothetical protein